MAYRMGNLVLSGAFLTLLMSCPVLADEQLSQADGNASVPAAAATTNVAGPPNGSCCDGAADPACRGRGDRFGGCRGGYLQRNAIPHYAYFPCDHGYYYFHPYNVSHIALHQSIATSWGIDARNPYSNEIFQKVYAQYEAEQPKAPASDPGYVK